jgi:hypothetical protein
VAGNLREGLGELNATNLRSAVVAAGSAAQVPRDARRALTVLPPTAVPGC